jgi:hypothetical protein
MFLSKDAPFRANRQISLLRQIVFGRMLFKIHFDQMRRRLQLNLVMGVVFIAAAAIVKKLNSIPSSAILVLNNFIGLPHEETSDTNCPGNDSCNSTLYPVEAKYTLRD